MSKQQIVPARQTEILLDWYDSNRRELPWRAAPGAWADPYRVWLSEIMLQQTLVVAVIPYFHNFLRRWPTISDLAAADPDDILVEWAGLGYYARARNLHACAIIVAGEHAGKFPQTPNELCKLPGIGPYTAAAIAAIAFNFPVMPVDGNIERVVARLEAIEAPLPGAKAIINRAAQALISSERPGDMAQALMDLGASLCAPKRVLCEACPLGEACTGREKGIAEILPVRAARKQRPLRRGTIFWVEREDGAVLLRQRPRKGLLGGMSEFPSTPWTEGTAATCLAAAMPDCLEFHDLASEAQRNPVRHVFTHFALELSPRRVRLPVQMEQQQPAMDETYRWVHPDLFHQVALPSVMKKVANLMLYDREAL